MHGHPLVDAGKDLSAAIEPCGARLGDEDTPWVELLEDHVAVELLRGGQGWERV